MSDSFSSDRSWPATAFQRDLPDGRAAGRLSVEGNDFVFRAPGVAPQRFGGSNVELRSGGFDGQQAFLSHPHVPGWTFLCGEPGFFGEEIIRQHPALRRRGRAASRWPWPVKALLALTALFMAGLAALWVYRAEVTGAIAARIPVRLERQLGDAVLGQVMARTKPVEDPSLTAQAGAIMQRLVPAVNDGRYHFKFHLVEDESINAFALPGGHIVIHTGLLRKARRPEEIAGVLAHEIAHITRRHSLRNMVSSLGTAVVIQAVLGDLSGLAGAASDLLDQKYSRDFEREADATGWQYLLEAGIDPRGMIDFFAFLSEEEKRTGLEMDGAMEWLSTHPATGSRREALEALWKKVPPGRTFEPLKYPPAGSH